MLCTQADIEKLLQITFGNQPDDTITQAIEQASTIVESYCGQALEESTDTATLEAGRGDTWLFLPRHPVTDVSSVVEDGDTLTVTDDYRWYEDGRLRRMSGDYETSWSTLPDAITVEFTAGWSTIPNDVVLVTAELAAGIFTKGVVFAAQGPVPIKSVALDGSDSVSYDTKLVSDLTGSDPATKRLKRLLGPYRVRNL